MNNIYLPPGWTHMFFASSLSPRGKKNLQVSLNNIELDPSFELLPPSLLHALFIDCGICKTEELLAAKIALRHCLQSQSHFKASFDQWSVDQSDGMYVLSVTLKDRYQLTSILQRELVAILTERYGFTFQQPLLSPRVILGRSKKKIPTPKIPLNGSIWIKSVQIFSRPKSYAPRRGYDVVAEEMINSEIIEDTYAASPDTPPTSDNDQHLQLLESRLKEQRTSRRYVHSNHSSHKRRKSHKQSRKGAL